MATGSPQTPREYANAMAATRRASTQTRLAAMSVGHASSISRAISADEKREEAKRLRQEEYARIDRERAVYAAEQSVRSEHLRPERIAEYSRDRWFALFASAGVDVIYNAIACGHTVASYGVERGFPPFYFRQWCDDHLDRKMVVTARRAAAEIAAHESIAIFRDPDAARNMQNVHKVRAQAQHLTWQAERKDAEAWGPPKAVPPQQAPVSLVVSIDGLSVPQEHLTKIAAKRAQKLLDAEAVFDPHGGKTFTIEAD